MSLLLYLDANWPLDHDAETLFLDSMTDTGVFVRPKQYRAVSQHLKFWCANLSATGNSTLPAGSDMLSFASPLWPAPVKAGVAVSAAANHQQMQQWLNCVVMCLPLYMQVLLDQDITHRLSTPSSAAGRPRYSLVWKLVMFPKQPGGSCCTAKPEWGRPTYFGSAAHVERAVREVAAAADEAANKKRSAASAVESS